MSTGRRPDLATWVGGTRLPNPVMTASGTAGHGCELGAYFDLSRLGAMVVKSLSPEPWAGNPSPRVHQAGPGMINSVGLQNPGLGAWIDGYLPALASAGSRVVASVWGRTVGEYRAAGTLLAAAVRAGRAGTAALVAVEANVSCPNVEDRRRMFAHSAAATTEAVAALVEGLGGSGLPVWAKLSPNVTDLPEMAAAALAGGAGTVTLTNTLMGLALDPTTGEAVLGAGGGGLSGPPLHPVAVRAVADCRAAFPAAGIVGVGGVAGAREAVEFLQAGADAIQVGTATFADPRAPIRVLAGLERWLRHRGLTSLSALRTSPSSKGCR